MREAEELSRWVLAAQVERALVHLEAATGESSHFANRPLNANEKAAKTRFGDIEAIIETNTAAGEAMIAGLYGAVIGGLLAAIFDDPEDDEDDGAVDDEDVVEAAALAALLAGLLSNPPQRVRDAQDEGSTLFGELIGSSYDGGVLTILDEAKRQGVGVADWDRPLRPVALEILGRDIAAHPWQRVVERALHEYQTPAAALAGPITRAELQKVFDATSQGGTLDLLHQANQAALNVGRNDTAANYVGEFIAAFASEILDQNTCGPCAAIDGTRFDSPEEAAAAYPAGYTGCLGRSRCRGVCVYVFDSPDA